MSKRLSAAVVAVVCAVGMHTLVSAQQIGRNVNMVAGPASVDEGPPYTIVGDPYLQRQNEPSGACSARNPLNCIAGANDYRTVNIPGPQDGKVTGDAWLGVFWTRDGGQTWRSSLVSGYPQDVSPEGLNSPAHGFEAAADPTVRAGTNGLFYYSGIAFDRAAISQNTSGVEGKAGVLFVNRFIDDNNTQNVDTPFRSLGATAVAYSSNAKFIDKPFMAVDVPRTGAQICTIPAGSGVPTQSFPAGNVYIVYTEFMGTDNVHSRLMFTRSTNCGQSFSTPIKLSESHKINQSGTIAIHPHTGQLMVAWREFNSVSREDAVLVAQSDDFGASFAKATPVSVMKDASGASTAFDLPTLPNADPLNANFLMMRTNSYPAMCITGAGRAYLVWADRALGPKTEPTDLGDSRIVYSTSTDGSTWTGPTPIENHSGRGHQFMPAVSCAGGKIVAAWYDQREDALPVFNDAIAELKQPRLPARTLDVRASEATDGGAFTPSVRVSRYLIGAYQDTDINGNPILRPLQLQYHLENMELFGGGKIPFIGDYLDVQPDISFLPASLADGQSGTSESGFTFKNKRRAAKNSTGSAPNGWVFNTSPQASPAFHVMWTDNRDAVPVADQVTPPCSPGTQGGSKNQNIYTARLTAGVAAGALGNARPFGDIQRAFAFYVQNTTALRKTYALTIANQPPGGKASFKQFPLEPLAAAPMTELTVEAPPYSAVARTVFVTSGTGSANTPIRVDVDEVLAGGGTGAQTFVVINADPTNPAPADVDVRGFDERHAAGVSDAEIQEFANPNFFNPNFFNPNFFNPNFFNPNFFNPNFFNPNFFNPNFFNPNFFNPNFFNPNFFNPNFFNPNFFNMSEMTWTVEGDGNVGSSQAFLPVIPGVSDTGELPDGWGAQLVIYRVYFAPGAEKHPGGGEGGCGTREEAHEELLANIQDPSLLNPNQLTAAFLNYNNPNFFNLTQDDNTGTFAIGTGDAVKVKLWLVHDGSFNPETASALVVPGAIDSLPADACKTPGNPLCSTVPGVSTSLTVTPTNVGMALNGAAFSRQLTAVGGTPPYAWVYVPSAGNPFASLPSGLSLSNAGVLTGTPQAAPGSYTFQVLVADQGSVQTLTAFLTIVVVDPLVITTTALPNGTNGRPYSHQLAHTGGAGTKTWTVASGTPPPGVTLSSAGLLAGTPTAAGTFQFDVKISDDSELAQTDTQTLTLLINSPMVVARGAHTATVLPNGKVLIAGGSPLGVPIATAELYDPATNTYSTSCDSGGPMATMTSPRASHTATLLPDGTVLLAGGYNTAQSGATDTAEIYIPSTCTFQATAGVMGMARNRHTATLLNSGEVLIVGGNGGTASAELYNPGTGTFAATGSLNAGRVFHTATLLPTGRVLIAGGEQGTTVFDSVEVYDRAANNGQGGFPVQASRTMASPRRSHVAALLPNGNVLLAGGSSTAPQTLTILSSADLYDPVLQTISSAGNMTVPRWAAAATTLMDGRVLIAGGVSSQPGGFVSSREVYSVTGGFSAAGVMSAAQVVDHATLLPSGKVLLTGPSNFSDLFEPAPAANAAMPATELRVSVYGSPAQIARVYRSAAEFNAALGQVPRETQNFNGFQTGTPISTIIPGVLDVASPFQQLEVFGGGVLFGFDNTTRDAGLGRYDLTFVASRNAIGFDLTAQDPQTRPVRIEVTTSAGTVSFLVGNPASELTGSFIGIISTLPIQRVVVREGFELVATINEEVSLDNFVVAQVP